MDLRDDMFPTITKIKRMFKYWTGERLSSERTYIVITDHDGSLGRYPIAIMIKTPDNRYVLSDIGGGDTGPETVSHKDKTDLLTQEYFDKICVVSIRRYDTDALLYVLTHRKRIDES